ncbi:MAG: hypothetical protein J5888_01345, partial [Bacteroidaceae bacterium]|nr:hypothetical protein [Bacteroidaceae bacterium]
MKTIKILLAGVLLTTLVSCDQLYQNFAGADMEQLDSLQQKDVEQMSEMLSAVALSLDSIQQQEELLNQFDESTPKDVMLSQLETLREMLDRKKAEIDQMTADSLSNGESINNLKKVLEYLSQQLEEKSAGIAKLEETMKTKDARIAKLSDQVGTLTVESSNLKAQTVEQENRLNQAFYLVGTKNELKNLGLLSGNLLGKKRANYSNIDNSKFHQVDTRNFNPLVSQSKSPKLLTENPTSSYT